MKFIFILLVLLNSTVITTEVETKTKTTRKNSVLVNEKYTQQLLFGSSRENNIKYHWCDIKLTPETVIIGATLFLKSNSGKKDAATPQSSLIPKKSPQTLRAYRIIIPNKIDKNPSKLYTFNLLLINNEELFSESFFYNKDLQEFSLVSAGRMSIFSAKKIIYASLGLLCFIVLFILLYFVKKSMIKA